MTNGERQPVNIPESDRMLTEFGASALDFGQARAQTAIATILTTSALALSGCKPGEPVSDPASYLAQAQAQAIGFFTGLAGGALVGHLIGSVVGGGAGGPDYTLPLMGVGIIAGGIAGYCNPPVGYGLMAGGTALTLLLWAAIPTNR